MSTINQLRVSLSGHFPEAATVMRRMAEVGLLPSGGRGGRGLSPEVSTEHAAQTLLALSSGSAPMDAPAIAADLASWRCVAWFDPPVGPCVRRPIRDSAVLLGRWLAAEIAEAAANPAHRTCGLMLEATRVSTLDPDELLAFERRLDGDGGAALRDVAKARERLEFGPSDAARLGADTRQWLASKLLGLRSDSGGRPYPAAVSRILEPAAIRAVAAAFRPRACTVLADAFLPDPAA